MTKHKILGSHCFYNTQMAEYQFFFFLIYFCLDNDTLLVDSPNNKVLVDESSTINTGRSCVCVAVKPAHVQI